MPNLDHNATDPTFEAQAEVRDRDGNLAPPMPEPVLTLRQDGRPAEREIDWLNRALPKAATLVDFREYVTPGASGDPITALKSDIYAGARTRTFHAKTGAAVLLPHDDATRNELRDSVSGLRRMYLDVAQTVLGCRFLGSSGLAPAGFQGHGVGSGDYADLRLE
jgi:hypothetical protein